LVVVSCLQLTEGSPHDVTGTGTVGGGHLSPIDGRIPLHDVTGTDTVGGGHVSNFVTTSGVVRTNHQFTASNSGILKKAQFTKRS